MTRSIDRQISIWEIDTYSPEALFSVCLYLKDNRNA